MGCCLSVVAWSAKAILMFLVGYLLLTALFWAALFGFYVYLVYSASAVWTPGVVVDIGIESVVASGETLIVDKSTFYVFGALFFLVALFSVGNLWLLRAYYERKLEEAREDRGVVKTVYGTV